MASLVTSDLTAVPEPPHLSEARASEILLEHFGVEGVLEPLPSERDANFRVRARDGSDYVLKCAAGNEELAALEAQNAALRAVAERGAIESPRIIAPRKGGEILRVDVEGRPHFVRLVTYVPGQRLVEVHPHDETLLEGVGSALGRMDKALFAVEHAGARRRLMWDLAHAHPQTLELLPHLDGPLAERVRHFTQRFEERVLPVLPSFRRSVIHSDGNDHNLICTRQARRPGNSHAPGWNVTGIIDFGDLVETYTVFEPAVAAAYAALAKERPLDAIIAVTRGYHRALPLSEAELAVIFPCVTMRLAFSIALATARQKRGGAREYLSVTLAPAIRALELLSEVSPAFAEAALRASSGLAPSRSTVAVSAWLSSHRTELAPLLSSLTPEETDVLDLSPGSDEVSDVRDLSDLRALEAALAPRMLRKPVWLGRYAEPRPFYAGEGFRTQGPLVDAQRTVHLGVDLFAAPGTVVMAPLAGRVHAIADNAADYDYGPTIVLEHEVSAVPGASAAAAKLRFFTLYGHLDPECLTRLRPGDEVGRGDVLARIGAPPRNGNWPPHLHFQIITDLLGKGTDFPGVCAAKDRELWLALSPDPSAFARRDVRYPSDASAASLKERRARHLGPSLSLAYGEPLHMVRGIGATLIDDLGRPFLDTVNNVCHVGHCHPAVVEAAQRQMALLNTNTRYLHAHLVDYAERLTALFPAPLEVCYFVCSGSEANELALRLARAHTRRRGVLVLETAYHGNTNALIDISPYKHDGRGGGGRPEHVHVLALPDAYRGKFRGAGAGAAYLAEARQVIEQASRSEYPVGAFFCETLLGCGGQLVVPPGYLAGAYDAVRAAGGVAVADEVQVGFGRVGSHYWAFETQGVVPDIVTLGKPMGNGHPLGAVITTRAIAESFHNGMEYFNTFGGNPVSCAIGLAVLDVIEREGLRQHALDVGLHLQRGLEELQKRHPLIGDVRGHGLFLGVELGLQDEARTPTMLEADYVVEEMKARGILSSTDGPGHNVLKIKPPLVISRREVERYVETLDEILGHSFVRR